MIVQWGSDGMVQWYSGMVQWGGDGIVVVMLRWRAGDRASKGQKRREIKGAAKIILDFASLVSERQP